MRAPRDIRLGHQPLRPEGPSVQSFACPGKSDERPALQASRQFVGVATPARWAGLSKLLAPWAGRQSRMPELATSSQMRSKWLVSTIFLCLLAISHLVCADDQTPPPTTSPVREEQTTLSKLADMVLPDAESLLRARPFDWLVLKNGDVLVIDPLPIRPDLQSVYSIRHDMAVHTYNRILRHKPYKEAELTSLRQYIKDAEKVKEFDAREAQIKQELDTARERTEALKPATTKIQVTLRDGSVDPDYLLELRYVDSVVYFEDLILRRADKLIEEGRTPLAYDLLLLVARRYRDDIAPLRDELEAEERSLQAQIKLLENERIDLRKVRDELAAPKNKNSSPAKMRLTAVEKTIVAIAGELKDLEDDLKALRFKFRFLRPQDFPNPDPPRKDDLLLGSWPRFDEVYQRLIFQDSDEQLKRGNTQEALRLLEEIWRPNADNPELSTRLSRVADKLIGEVVERKDYRQARHFLGDLTARVPSNSVIEKWKQNLADKAVTTVQEARTLASQGDVVAAARTIDAAARIWPDASGLREAHRELTGRYQILRVGVLDLATDLPNAMLPSTATERERWLIESKLFEPAGISDQGVRYRSAYFDLWEPTDLGRRVQFILRPKRAEWEARPLVTAADIHAEVMAQIDPQSPNYNDRLAGFVNGVTVQGPFELTVTFRQLPLRPEALWQLTIPVGAATRSLNDDIPTTELPLGRLRFQPKAHGNQEIQYTRVRPQAASIRQRRVDEVSEVRYASWDHLLQGLLRGEISFAPVAALRDLKALQDDGRFSVVPYALPRTHLLMFNPKTRALADGQVRRALLHAVPRQQLLKNIVLREASTSHGRLATGPFATTSYGHNRLLPQADYDPPLAAALALTGKKQLGGTLPEFRMTCPNDPALREVCSAMIDEWKRIGIEVTLIDDPASSDWDICYRTVKSIEPLMDIWSLLTFQETARVDGLQSLPESTRRKLLELERAVDWTTATRQLHRLLADQQIEARYIPLWEVDEYLVARKNITGIPAKPIHTYDDIERWTVQSWYSTEAP